MRRHTIAPRPGWQKTVAATGLTCHTLPDGKPYWDESAYWEFTSAEIDRLEAATAEIQRLALAAGDHILDQDRLAEMKIPNAAAAQIRETWKSEPPALYGRMDLAFDGRQIKLLEYNADTPTSLVEAAVTQWYWLQDRFPDADQFNSLHEKLVSKWKDLRPYLRQPVYFGHDGSEEDFMTISYLRDTAGQAGHLTVPINMHDVGWEEAGKRFVDLDRRPMHSIFKLYPWEWMLGERFASHALETMGAVLWVEPIWKMMWSNKSLLAILWELNPNHEFLLPAYSDGPRNLKDYVCKPVYGREGAGVKIFRDWVETENGMLPPPHSEEEGFVYQKLASLAVADGNTAVIGSWLIDGEPAGIGIRESSGTITTNTSRFVPHLFR
ncbi:MAG TPA: glutathionylspermidine synthase family protein [Terracidiphilus sp.]|jgi:glutathionylspermidine synthase